MRTAAIASTAVVALFVGIIAFACRGDGDSGSGDPIDPAFAQLVADEALLTLDDLGGDWEIAEADEDDDDDEESPSDAEFERRFQECSGGLEFDEDDDIPFPGQIAEGESDDFDGPDDLTISTSAVVFQTEDEARDALDELRDAFSNCQDVFRDAFRTGFEEAILEDGGDPSQLQADLDLSEPDVDGVGDDAYALVIDVDVELAEGLSMSFQMQFTLFVRDRMGGGLFAMSFGSEIEEDRQRALLDLVDEKLAKANDRLDDGPEE